MWLEVKESNSFSSIHERAMHSTLPTLSREMPPAWPLAHQLFCVLEVGLLTCLLYMIGHLALGQRSHSEVLGTYKVVLKMRQESPILTSSCVINPFPLLFLLRFFSVGFCHFH